MKKFITPEDYPHSDLCEYDYIDAVRSSSIIALGRDNVLHDETGEALRFTLFLRFIDYRVSWNYKTIDQRDEVFDLLLKDLNESQ